MNQDTKIQVNQLQQMLSVSKSSIATSIFLALALVFIQRDVISPEVVLIWFALLLLVAFGRIALVVFYQRCPDLAAAHGRLMALRVGVLLNGVVWGSAGYFLFPGDDQQHQMFLVFMLAGLTAGGVVSNSSDLVSAIGFAITSLTPLAIRLFFNEGSLSMVMGIAVLLYLGFVFFTLRHINKSVLENMVLHLEAAEREEVVRGSEERYRLLLGNSPAGIFHYDTDLIISYCNERFAQILNSSVERVIGLDMTLLRDTSVLSALDSALEGNSGHYAGRYRATFSDADIWIDMACAPVRDSKGTIMGGIAIVQDITERKKIEDAMEENREKYRGLSEAAFEAIFISENGRCLEQNSRAQEMFGYTQEESIGRMGTEWIAPEDRKSVMKNMISGNEMPYEVTALRKDGSTFPAVIRGRMMHYKGRAVRVTSLRDITDQKRAEAELRIAATAFETQEGMLIVDASGEILRVNRAFTKITGYSPDEVVGKNPRMLSSGRHDEHFYKQLWSALNATGTWEGEIWNRRKNGEIYPEYLSITAVKNIQGVVSNFVASLSDITARKAAENEIRSLAFFDPLTRLPNRRLLSDRLEHALASSARTGMTGAILFIDLDNFKSLNDTLGHDTGDMLLQQVAQRLSSCVREDDTVARMGGDEFVLILENLSKNSMEAAAQVELVGEKILATLGLPYMLALHEYRSTPSIGASLFVGRKSDLDELMKQADIAMYQAKKAGRNTLRFFDPVMQSMVAAHVALEADLRSAISEQEQFQLFYQPQVESTGRVIGVEALVRWVHPERGMVSPADFIPLAEESGLILPLGHWVLATACRQLASWAQDPDMSHLTMAVNISAKQFGLPTFAEEVLALVDYFQIDPVRLKLEITESMLAHNVEELVAKMRALKDKGISFSMDDFGTGYSSLQYLKRLPLDQLKIDQSFVRDIVEDSSDRAIVKTIIAMARSLDLDVIAEGVETEEQKKILLRKGCVCFQGYLFGRPVPIEQFDHKPK